MAGSMTVYNCKLDVYDYPLKHTRQGESRSDILRCFPFPFPFAFFPFPPYRL